LLGGLQTVKLNAWHLSMLGGLCLSDSINLLVALEQVEWSLFDIPYNFTPQNLSMLGGLCFLYRIALLHGTYVCWVVFVCQTA